MKKLNIPLLLFLIIGGLASVIGIHYVHQYQVAKNVDSLLARAQEAEKNGDIDEQIRLLQRYLRYQTDDMEQKTLLFRIIRERAMRDADYRTWMANFTVLENTLIDHPDHEGLRREAYLSANEIGRWADAEDHLQALELMPDATLSPEDHVNWALIKWRNSDGPAAVEKLCDLIGFDMETREFVEGKATAPEEVYAYTSLAGIYLRDYAERDDSSIPNKILDKAIERNPQSADAYLRRAAFIRENDKDDASRQRSIADARKALELEPDSLNVIGVATRMAFGEGDFAWAEEILARGKEAHADSPMIYRLMALSSKYQGNLEEGIKRLNEGLEALPLNSDLLAERAELEVDANNLEAANQTIKRLAERRSFSPIRLDFLRARVLIADGKPMPASRILERLRSEVSEGNPLRRQIENSLATCFRAMNMQDRLRDLAVEEGTVQGRFQQAMNLAAQSRYDDAVKIFVELMSDENVPPEGRTLIMRQMLSTLMQKERDKPVAERDWTQVDKLADKIAPADASPAFREAVAIDLLVQKEMASEALRRVQTAISRFPREATFRMTLAKLTPDHEQAMSLLDRLEESLGPTLELRLAQIERVARNNDPDELRMRLQGYLDSVTQLDKEDERSRVLQALVLAYREAGMQPEALQVAKRRVEDGDNSINALLSYFDAAIEARDDAAVGAAQEKVAELATKDSPEWRICEARRRLELIKAGNGEGQDPADIMLYVEAARRDRPSFSPIHAIRAEVFLLQNKDAEAIESLREALRLQPGDPSYLRLLYKTLAENNRIAEANQVLAQMPNAQGGGNASRAALVEIQQLLQSDPAAAIAKAEEAFPKDSDDPEVLHQLANIYFAAGDNQAAIGALQGSLRLDGSNRRAWLLLVRSYMKDGKPDQAKAVIEKSATVIPQDERALAVGQMYSESGDLAKALQSYQDGIDANPNDTLILVNMAKIYQFQKDAGNFNATLDRLIGIKDATTQTDLASIGQARRMKAQQLQATGIYSDFQKAIELLEENRNERGNLVGEDLLLWLQICASRPDPASRRKASDKLEEIRGERSLSVAESVILAGIRYREGNWRQAESMILDIMSKTNEPGYTMTYIGWLLERGEVDSAAKYLSRSGLNPDSPQVLPFTMQVLVLKGKSKDAYQRLMKQVPATLNHGQAAVIMEQVAKHDPVFYKGAKQQWGKYITDHPEQIGNYIDFLARLPDAGGLDDAIDLTERELQKAVRDQKANVAQYYLGLGLKALRAARNDIPKDSPTYERVYKFFALAKQAGVEDSSFNQFDFFDIRQDYDRLKQLYNDYLSRTDTSELERAVIRNNLSFLYSLSNEGQLALSTIGDAINQLGPRPDFLDTRGLAYMVSGQLELALADLQQAARGNSDPGVLFHLAYAQLKSKNREAATVAFDQAIALGLDPDTLAPQERTLFDTLQTELKTQ